MNKYLKMNKSVKTKERIIRCNNDAINQANSFKQRNFCSLNDKRKSNSSSSD